MPLSSSSTFAAASSAMDSTPALGTALFFLAVLALIAVGALGSALGVIFRVALYRHSTEGQPAGGFAEQDMVAAFRAGGRGAS